MSSDDSFFGLLTNFTGNQHEVTELSRLLICVIAFNACSARRNTLTIYKLVETLRDVCNGTGTLVEKVDDITEVDDWSAYDRYTATIDPLETLLLEFLNFTDKVGFDEFLGKAATATDVIETVKSWEDSRKELRDLVKKVITQSEFKVVFPKLPIPESEWGIEEKHDDLVLLSALCGGISKHELKDEDISGGKMSETIAGMKVCAANIAMEAKMAPSDRSIFQSIRCTMIVHGAMALSQTERQVKNSAAVWNTAKELLENVKSHLSAPPGVSEAILEEGWNKLKALLENFVAELPEEYLALRKLVKNVRRPYHARSLALIRMCKDLAVEFSKPGKNTTGNFSPLKVALTAATEAVEKGKTTLLDTQAAGTDLSVTDGAFTKAATKLRPDNQGSDDMKDASKKDSEWVKKLNDLGVDKFQQKGTPPTSTQLVIVKVSYTLGTNTEEKTYNVDVETQLSIILWKVVSEPLNPFPRDKLVGAYFETKDANPEKLPFDRKVGTAELKLVLKMARSEGAEEEESTTDQDDDDDESTSDGEESEAGGPGGAGGGGGGSGGRGGDVTVNIYGGAESNVGRLQNKVIAEETSSLHHGTRYFDGSRDAECGKILDWIHKPENPILWLHGGAGIGKSTVVHHLIPKLKELRHLATYCFFVRDSVPMQNLNTVIEHMAYLLFTQYPEIRSYLSTDITPDPTERLSVSLEAFIVKPLGSLTSDGTKVIIFDALNECHRSTQLIEAIHELCPKLRPNVKFLITSRPERNIMASIFQKKDKVFELGLLPADELAMTNFFKDRLKVVPEWRPSADEIRKLVSLADGLYLWATTVCTFITSSDKIRPSIALQMVLSLEHCPTENQLGVFYKKALNHLFPSKEKGETFRLVFGAMFVVFKPLHENVLEQLVDPKIPTSSVVSTLRSLQTRLPMTSTIAAPAADLFHMSFLDFVVSDRSTDDGTDNHQFRVLRQDAHKFVASRCFSIMKEAFVNPRLASTNFSDLPEVVQYGIENWASHVNRSNSNVQEDGWAEFWQNHGRRWGKLLLEAVTESNNEEQVPGEWLPWLNAKFLNLYETKSLGRHLQMMIDLNQAILSRSGPGKDREFRSGPEENRKFIDLTHLFGKSIKKKRNDSAISLWPSHYPDLPSSLNSLATVFQSRFEQTGTKQHLEEAISLNQAALVLQPDKSRTLNDLANCLYWRFIQNGAQEDLMPSFLHRMTLSFSPNNLAVNSETIKDLDKAISLHQEALKLRSSDHPDRDLSLTSLANALRSRAANSGSKDDLKKAIFHYNEALEMRPDPHPHRPFFLNNLANALEFSAANYGSRDDLDEAISLHRKVRALLSADHKLPYSLNSLANALQFRAANSGGDMNEAISLHRKSLELMTPHHPHRSHSLTGLANALQFRGANSGDDLDEGISLHLEALKLRPAPHPDRPLSLTSVANALQSRAAISGSRADLDKAISYHCEAVEMRPAPHPDRPVSLTSLANALRSRAASKKDLDEAISHCREALEMRPAPHPDRLLSLNNLAAALRSRAANFGTRGDLDEVIPLHQEALKLMPPSHSHRFYCLTSLANALQFRAANSGSRDDLDEAISHYREALKMRPDRSDRLLSLNNLAAALRSRAAKFGSRDHEEAISLEREAGELRPARLDPLSC